MSEYVTEQERIKELEDKIHQLKMKKLLKIEYITDKTDIVVDKLEALEGELKKSQDVLTGGNNGSPCELKEVKRWEAVIKCIKTRKDVLTGFKQVLHEARLSIRLIMKQEDQLTLRKIQLEATGE